VKLTNEMQIARPAQEVFDTLLDVEKVAVCMPGSRLLGRVDDDTYQGEVTVKVGPLGASYTGTVRFLEVDRDARTATLKASGREMRGQGNADAHVVARVESDGDGAKVVIDTDLMIRGKVAQFGRGVIGDVSGRLMTQFAGNVEQLLNRQEGQADGTPAPPAAGASAPATGSDAPTPAKRPEAPPPAARHRDEEPAGAALDGLSLIAVPLLKRSVPLAVASGVGLAVGMLLRGHRGGLGRPGRGNGVTVPPGTVLLYVRPPRPTRRTG